MALDAGQQQLSMGFLSKRSWGHLLHLADSQMQGHLAGFLKLGLLQLLPPLLLEQHKVQVSIQAAKGFLFLWRKEVVIFMSNNEIANNPKRISRVSDKLDFFQAERNLRKPWIPEFSRSR